MAICSFGLSCATKSSATGRTVSPTRLVSNNNITSTMSLENSAASAFRASLSSYRVNSSAFNPKAGLPDFASTTVTETRFAAATGKAQSSAAIQNLILNFDLHPRIEPCYLGRGHMFSILDAIHDFRIGSETVADLDLPGFDRICVDHINFIRA